VTKTSFGSVSEKINKLYHNSNETTANDQSSPINYSPLVPSLNFSSAYQYLDENSLAEYHNHKFDHHRYSRDSSPMVNQTERIFSFLLNRPSLLFSSGMSAMWAALWVSAPVIDAFISIGSYYRKTTVLLNELSALTGKPHTNLRDVDDVLESKLSGRPLLLIESPSNPLLKIHNVEILRNAYPDAVIVYDNTFVGLENDLLNLPLVDFQVSSCTKYIGGHNDLIAGFISVANDEAFQKVWNVRSSQGGIPDPISAYLLFRSLKTYDVRIAQMVSNAEHVLDWMSCQPSIKTIYYPGRFANEDQSELFSRSYRHGGSVISLEIKEGNNINLTRTQLFSTKMAPSFGSTDTLIERPASMSHAGKTDAELEMLGISRNLLRLSIGMEPIEFILEDLQRVLA